MGERHFLQVGHSVKPQTHEANQTSTMTKPDEKKRPAAAGPGGDDSAEENSGVEAKRRGTGRASSSRKKDLMNVPVQVGNKAVVPQHAAAAKASNATADNETNKAGPDSMNDPVQAGNKAVVPEQAVAAKASNTTADNETNKAGPGGHFDIFELEMKRLKESKSAKTGPTTVASPSQSSPQRGGPKASKVWVAGLKSGEMVAYVTDRNHPEIPAFIREGLARIRDDDHLREVSNISEIIKKKADKQPFTFWALPKISQTTQTAYTLHWFVLVREFKNFADHTPQARIKWGETLAELFALTDPPNRFEYGGDLSKDKACTASNFFTVQDVMEQFIKKRLDGMFSESEIVKNLHLMDSYYGDDVALNGQVVQFYMPKEQPDEGGGRRGPIKTKSFTISLRSSQIGATAKTPV